MPRNNPNEWSPPKEIRQENGWTPQTVRAQVGQARRKSKMPFLWIVGIIWLLSVIGEAGSVFGDLIGMVILVLLVPGLIIWLALRRKKAPALKEPEPVMEVPSMEGMPLEPAPLVTPEPVKVEPVRSVFKNLMHMVEAVEDSDDLSASFQSAMSKQPSADPSQDGHDCYESHSHYAPFSQEPAAEAEQSAPAEKPEPAKPEPVPAPAKRGISREELRRSVIMSEVLGKPVARRGR